MDSPRFSRDLLAYVVGDSRADIERHYGRCSTARARVSPGGLHALDAARSKAREVPLTD
jgi:hypothetical protein